jgi:hypothetical protein
MDDEPIDMEAVIVHLSEARDDIAAALRSGDRAAIIAAERLCEVSLDELEHFGAIGLTDHRLRALRIELAGQLSTIQRLI